MPVLVAPDLELILPGKVYNALRPKYPRLMTDRAAPADLGGRPIVVLHREGGLSHGQLLDQARIAVDVYASTDATVNRLSADVRGVLESLQGHNPIIKVDATGPSPIVGAVPQRRFYADVLMRKVPA